MSDDGETHRTDEESVDEESESSEEELEVIEVLSWVLDENCRLAYWVECVGGKKELVDRSDLMDGCKAQRLVLKFERRNKLPWDQECPHCGTEGCDECECPDCDRMCRFMEGVNYGCEKHPVV